MSHRRVAHITVGVFGLTLALTTAAPAQCTRDRFAPDDTRTTGFGYSISVDGDMAVIGAPYSGTDYVGAAYVYRRTASGWTVEQTLEPRHLERQFGMRFGRRVAIHGEVIAVAAPELDIDQTFDRGAVYVYRRGPSGFDREYTIFGLGQYAQIGWTLELQDNLLLVGSVGAGVVATYEYDGQSWIAGPVIQSSESGANARFGYGLALTGSTLLVGAPSASIANQFGAGKVHVFERTGSSWDEVQVLTASDPDWYQFFGDAIAVDGDVALFGSSDHDGAGRNQGAAYVFRRLHGTWSEEARLFASDAGDDDYFGESVAIQDDVALVAAPSKRGKSLREGAAYRFRREMGLWREAKLHPAYVDTGTAFGRAMTFLPSMPDHAFLVGSSFSLYENDKPGFVTEWRGDADQAQWFNYGSGWPGTHGVPELTSSAAPWIGTEVEISVGNSSSVSTPGAFLLGLSRDAIVTPFDGTLELSPTLVLAIWVPAAGLTLPVTVPLDPTLTGVSMHTQVLQRDAGASKGVSFTPGLGLRFGTCR